MGLHYAHIDLAERRQIQDMVAAGVPVAVIARRLGRHRSTVHREIGRNFHHTSFRDQWGKDYRGYYCLPADDSARKRRGHQAKLTRRTDLREHVVGKLRSGWSPQQIAGRLKHVSNGLGTVSHETIYQFVYGPEGRRDRLFEMLAMARRRQRFGRKPRRGPFPTERGIEWRPAEVANRDVFGHWEGDLVIFARTTGTANLTTLIERQSRYLILLSNPDRRSLPVMGRIEAALGTLPSAARTTMTFDRGTEFAAWRTVQVAESYFCDPHSPWQKGGVENANGRIRRHLPLASAAEERSSAALANVAERLNATPRRCLGYRTPAEVFASNLASLPASR